MGKKENIEALVSQIMRNITWSTKFWSQAWKDEFASRLASEVEAHLTLRATDEFLGHAKNCVLRVGGYACTCKKAQSTRR